MAAAIRDAGGSAEARALHVGDPAAIEALFAALDAEGKVATLLVNNAAANPYFGPMLDMDLGSYEKTVEVNLRGYFWTVSYTHLDVYKRQIGGSSCVAISATERRTRGGST